MALTADDPPTPRPRAYGPGGCCGVRLAMSSGHSRPGSAIAANTSMPAMPAGVSDAAWSAPASSSSTDRAGSSLSRAATTAPAEPAPTTMWS